MALERLRGPYSYCTIRPSPIHGVGLFATVVCCFCVVIVMVVVVVVVVVVVMVMVMGR